MNEKTITEHQACVSPCGNDPAGISLRGFSTINATATALGLLAVFILNVSTPLDFIRDIFASLIQLTGLNLVLVVLDRLLILLGITAVASGLSALAMRFILRPVSCCLDMLKAGDKPSAEWTMDRGRSLLITLTTFQKSNGFRARHWTFESMRSAATNLMLASENIRIASGRPRRVQL